MLDIFLRISVVFLRFRPQAAILYQNSDVKTRENVLFFIIIFLKIIRQVSLVYQEITTTPINAFIGVVVCARYYKTKVVWVTS